ncbi:MAG TPA: Uma2 family endonuclease [Leptolyngbyaceae cyanobacterium]
MALTVSQERIDLPPGSEVKLRYQTWDDYEMLLASRRDNAAIKIRFHAHTQEISITAPLPGHGRRIDILADLIKAMLRYQERNWDSSHPLTLRRLREAGAEPDACFYIENWQAILGKDRIDWAEDPPPDLAIKMDLTSLTDLTVYEILAVLEIWIYREGILQVYVLTAEGYRDSQASLTFPDIDVRTVLPRYVERAWQRGLV